MPFSRVNYTEILSFVRKYPLVLVVAKLIGDEVGFPFNSLPVLPALFLYFRELYRMPTLREAGRSLLRSVLTLLGYLLIYVVGGLLLRRKMTKWQALAYVCRRWMKNNKKQPGVAPARPQSSTARPLAGPAEGPASENATGPVESATAPPSWSFFVRTGSTECGCGTVTTEEQLRGIYDTTQLVRKIAPHLEIYCLKSSIGSAWEDPVEGRKWTLSFSKGKADDSWLQTLLSLINGQFLNEDVCGVVLSVGDVQDKISLWIDAENEDAKVSIGKQWKGILDSNETLGFIFDEDAKFEEKCQE